MNIIILSISPLVTFDMIFPELPLTKRIMERYRSIVMKEVIFLMNCPVNGMNYVISHLTKIAGKLIIFVTHPDRVS